MDNKENHKKFEEAYKKFLEVKPSLEKELTHLFAEELKKLGSDAKYLSFFVSSERRIENLKKALDLQNK